MKKIIITLSSIFIAINAIAQTFNGNIEFKYFNSKDTSTNIYIVKDKVIKLDQYKRSQSAMEGSFIFDLNANTVKFLNPKRRVWGINKSETPPIIKGQCVVTKGGTKKIQGTNCNEYIVKNTEENTQITYWIATEKYNFFIPLLKLWNRKDKQSIYFAKIEGLPEGSMPFLSEEKSISDGKVISKLEVIKITKRTPEDSELEVPAGYNKYDQ
ncbi:MAG: DUF4412 domain-containing protein [Bacteroidota bacterium]|jgi:hypothetical protein|nr:DUF4412 domain-containing protein [Bacteroidota bacterium]MCA6442473.1 DUF4412 domain-containing protein [Bacteroidota bacterium]